MHTTKISDKQAQLNQMKASEHPVDTEQMPQPKEADQLEPTVGAKAEQKTVPKIADEVTETQVPATSHEAEVQQEIEEVDAGLADWLTTADFVTGSSNHSARQLNAVLAIVNHVNGKRTKVQKEVLQKLNIQVGDFVNSTVKNNQVILLKSVNGEGVQLKNGGYLYNSELVEAITKEFAFDFSNQSTNHLLSVTYKKWNEQVIAVITA